MSRHEIDMFKQEKRGI